MIPVIPLPLAIFCSRLPRFLVREMTGLAFLPSRGPYILAANHVGWFDPFFMVAAILPHLRRQIYFLSKTNRYRWFKSVPIDTKHPSDAIDILSTLLKQEEIVAIFIEGRANPTSILDRGKTGVARLVLKNHVPVFPIGLDGPHGETVEESFRDFFRGLSRVAIRIGEPMSFTQYFHFSPSDSDAIRMITVEIMQKISALSGKPYPYLAMRNCEGK